MILNFLEIGTSNFDSLAIAYPYQKGITVEALKVYQDYIPDTANIRKINAAVVGSSESKRNVTFFYVHPDDISRYNLPWWMKGCNSMNHPHPEAIRDLRVYGERHKTNIMHLMKNVTVPTLSYLDIVENVTHINFVKLDMEGTEVPVLSDLMHECRHRRLCPTHLRFEYKHVVNNKKNKPYLGEIFNMYKCICKTDCHCHTK